MNVALMPQRPPYVEFEQRFVEDRTETIKQKKLVLKDVDFAIIRPIGGKTTIEKEALPWLEHIEQQGREGNYPQEWSAFFREQYSKWKAGQEIGPNGTHVRNWAAISRAQAEMLVQCRVLTVEDLAAANEETLQRIGMGARELKARAQGWLEVAAKNGAAEELIALRVENESLKESNKSLAARLDALEARLEAEDSGRKRRA